MTETKFMPSPDNMNESDAPRDPEAPRYLADGTKLDEVAEMPFSRPVEVSVDEHVTEAPKGPRPIEGYIDARKEWGFTDEETGIVERGDGYVVMMAPSRVERLRAQGRDPVKQASEIRKANAERYAKEQEDGEMAAKHIGLDMEARQVALARQQRKRETLERQAQQLAVAEEEQEWVRNRAERIRAESKMTDR